MLGTDHTSPRRLLRRLRPHAAARRARRAPSSPAASAARCASCAPARAAARGLDPRERRRRRSQPRAARGERRALAARAPARGAERRDAPRAERGARARARARGADRARAAPSGPPPDAPPSEPPTPPPSRRSPREPRHVRAVPTNAELKIARALELFNASDHPRTVGGRRALARARRSSRAPASTSGRASCRSSSPGSSRWYRYEVDLADEAGGRPLDGQGAELDRARRASSRAERGADERGALRARDAAQTVLRSTDGRWLSAAAVSQSIADR